MRMSNSLLRLALRATQVPQRTLSSSSVCSRSVVLDAKLREEIYPKIGNREVVGFGVNGSASYVDRGDIPFPAIRFREPTPEIDKLREKEKGNWNKLSLEEKKQLYRYSFCQTFSEVNAPTGEWKVFVSAILVTFALTGWMILYTKKFINPPPQRTLTREWQELSLQRMLEQQQGAIFGVSSKWDYDKLEWKK